MSLRVIHGDSRQELAALDAGSIDACVTDPPYALKFMGQKWDTGEAAFEPSFWREVFRVLKPGAHVVAFGGTRTYHRLACAIEDAGFEIRDMIGWLYGSGFPKSHDVSMAIDKAERGVPHGGADPTSLNHGKFKGGCSDNNKRGQGFGAGPGQFMAEPGVKIERDLTGAAKEWQGWGTALKPAQEPICLARKPLIGTVAANVLAHGTGALNIDGCRIPVSDEAYAKNCSGDRGHDDNRTRDMAAFTMTAGKSSKLGRFPANIVHDGSEEVIAAFPETGISSGGSGESSKKTALVGNVYGQYSGAGSWQNAGGLGDSGSAARFFYTAKADDDDRLGSEHPTVKPVDLMQWLVRLVTPKGGLVLDPFAGTGTTGEAAHREGCKAILIEREARFVEDIHRRVRLLSAGPGERRRETTKAKGETAAPGPLFGETTA